MSFMVGDEPTHIVLELPQQYDPDGFTGVTHATLGGEVVPADYDADAGTVILEPDTLDTAGILRVVARLTLASAGGTASIELEPVVVEDPASQWATLAEARRTLTGSDLTDATLAALLDVSRVEVLEYAPTLPSDAPVPLRFRLAQIAHSRNKLNAAKVGTGGDLGDGSFALARHPLDWQIKQTLRPQRGVPAVG